MPGTPVYVDPMITAKPTTSTDPGQHYAKLGQRLIHDVLANSRHLLELVLEATRLSLKAREDQARTAGEHYAMMQARQQLARLGDVLTERYPAALRVAIHQEADTNQTRRALSSVQFDELELMDETQISESVERARALQALAPAVEGPLAELDAMMGAVQGLSKVQPEKNPLRPITFVQALQVVVSQMQLTNQMRNDWMAHMAPALGDELRKLYLALLQQLRHSGVQPLGYALRQPNGRYVYLPPPDSGASPGMEPDPLAQASGHPGQQFSATGAGQPARQPAQTSQLDSLLTLDRLRRLLTGELGHTTTAHPSPAPAASFGEQFARDFESGDALQLPDLPDLPAPDFDATVPAALEALQEMQQVDHLMERLDNQRARPGADSGAGAQYAVLCRQPGGLARALSMEVVSLMVDNIARDSRLLWPVQQFIRTLEPALLQLALADPRFFNDKEHAARRLLQEITSRSLAFNSQQAPEFKAFLQSLLEIAGPLASADIDGPEPFEHALQQLQAAWAAREQVSKQERLRAIEALQHAEQRHLLAAKLSGDLSLLPQIDKVPAEISCFVLGPWAQVMAQARLADQTGSADPGRYREVVDALLWSAQPALTRLNSARLARLVPTLLEKLRSGLSLIDYPPQQTRAFFEQLMLLHQGAFKSSPTAEPLPLQTESRPALRADDEPWVAPLEAAESGFMDVATSTSAPGAMPDANGTHTPTTPAGLAVGTWVDLLLNGQCQRAQLSWVGPHGKLFLFTDASGRTHSMTLRLLNELIAQDRLRVLTQQTVVDEALDAVALAAMRNSVDSRL